MSGHTKEPWHFGKYNPQCIMGSDNKLIVSDCYEDREKDVANARRIVACVNACAGIDTNELEKYGALAILGRAKKD